MLQQILYFLSESCVTVIEEYYPPFGKLNLNDLWIENARLVSCHGNNVLLINSDNDMILNDNVIINNWNLRGKLKRRGIIADMIFFNSIHLTGERILAMISTK